MEETTDKTVALNAAKIEFTDSVLAVEAARKRHEAAKAQLARLLADADHTDSE